MVIKFLQLILSILHILASLLYCPLGPTGNMKEVITLFLLFSFNNQDLKYGVIKFYNEDKGFGYIVDESSKDEIFVYEEGLVDEVYDKDSVQYYIKDTRKGFEAYDVRLR